MSCIKGHKWPGMFVWASYRGMTSVEVIQCNNCCAMKITQDVTVMRDGRWVIERSVTLVEPNDPGEIFKRIANV